MPAFVASPDFDEALAEMERLRQEVFDILAQTGTLSEEFARHAQNWSEGVANVGLGAARVAASVGSGVQVAEIAIGTVVAAAVVEGAINKLGQFWAGVKRNWALAELLAKKRELARLKLPLVEQLQPRINRMRKVFRQSMRQSAAVLVSPGDLPRHEQQQEGVLRSYEPYVDLTVLRTLLRSAEAEMKAWVGGRQQSDFAFPSPEQVELECAGDLLDASKVPERMSPNTVLAGLTEGAVFLLRDAMAANHLMRHRLIFRRLVRALANVRFRTLILPFGAQRQHCLPLYRESLLRSPVLVQAVRSRVRWFVAAIVLLVAAAGGFFGRDKLRKAWEGANPTPIAERFGQLPATPPGPEWSAFFAAMSPAEHLAAGKQAMADGYDATTKLGGKVGLARQHLEAAAGAASVAKEAKPLLVALSARQLLMRQEIAKKSQAATAPKSSSPLVIQASGPEARVLRVIWVECTEATLNQMIGDSRTTLAEAGFTGLECLTGTQRFQRDL